MSTIHYAITDADGNVVGTGTTDEAAFENGVKKDHPTNRLHVTLPEEAYVGGKRNDKGKFDPPGNLPKPKFPPGVRTIARKLKKK